MNSLDASTSHPHQELQRIAKDLGFQDLNNPAFAKELDKQDTLSSFRDRFLFPKSETTHQDFLYFTGNSLGLQPKTTRKYIEQELNVWENAGVEGHFQHAHQRPWLHTDEFVVDGLCHITGAQKEE